MCYNELRDLVMAGVNWELGEEPMPTAPAAASTPRTAQNMDNNRMGATIVPPIAPTQQMSPETAMRVAARPTDIDSMLRIIAEFNHPLRATVSNVVLPHIAPKNGGMLILTDIPGADDDACGKILTGAAGELLDKMMGAIGQTRDSVSIIPMMFWRTPGGRAPTHDEIALARPFVDRLISMLAPSVILTLGTLPATEVGGVRLPADHGHVVDIDNGIKLVPIYHPNYLLLKPGAKRDAWTALQTVQNLLKNVEK